MRLFYLVLLSFVSCESPQMCEGKLVTGFSSCDRCDVVECLATTSVGASVSDKIASACSFKQSGRQLMSCTKSSVCRCVQFTWFSGLTCAYI